MAMEVGSVSIIIPVKNGLPYFKDVCAALKAQDYDGPVEVICIDSGSQDGSIEVAESFGYRVEHIKPKDFGHGKTRNFGASLTKTEFIAFLTHDAIPADVFWLSNLLSPMREDPEIAGVFSRHEAHFSADPFVAWELKEHFRGLVDFPVVQIVDRAEYDANLGLQQVYHFYSDNSSAMRRSVWEKYPYPDVQFAEDQIWAKTVVEAGYKKAFAQDSVVRHSHAFGPWETLRRSFDESRAFRKLFGYKLGTSVGGIFKSFLYLLKRDVGNAFKFGWWRSHPIKTLSKIFESFARPFGHYLGSKENLPTVIEKRISRDDWIRSL
jgi:glycosyltransferase involved in cell wall biosynthesis